MHTFLRERAALSGSSGGFTIVRTSAGERLPHELPPGQLMAAGIRDITAASSLPVLVDADDGYGDTKNVARTMRTYEDIGVAAIFFEDQVAPKRCGHMAGKDVVPAGVM